MKIRRALFLIAALTLAALTVFTALPSFAEVPARPVNGFLRDKAGALTTDEAEELESIISALHEKNGSGVYFVITDGFDGKTAADYAADVFGGWKLSEREMVLVVDVAGMDYYALTGEEISKQMSADSLKALLASSMEPAFASKNISAAILSFCNSSASVLSTLTFVPEGGGTNVFLVIFIILLVFTALFIVGVLILRAVNIRRSRRRRQMARYSAGKRPLPPRRPRR